MADIEVLAIARISAEERERIMAVDPSVRLTDAGGWFDGEYRDSWPAATARRYLAPDANGHGSRDDRDALLARAEVVLGGWPFPLDLAARAPNMRWFHQRVAGASNLRLGDLWGAGVAVTTSRGHASSTAIAEYVIAGMLHFAKGLHRAELDRAAGQTDHRPYQPLLLQGKTLCVVGAGGIGREVGRLAAALGVRVVGTRRTRPPPGAALPQGFTEIRSAEGLHDLLAISDFVAICAQWTPENTNMIGAAAFAAMKPGALVINIARGELLDEGALAAALNDGRIRGAVLDVYVGEFEHGPPDALWSDPRVLITPHISTVADRNLSRGIDLFCDNLRAWIDGGDLVNVIDWKVGY